MTDQPLDEDEALPFPDDIEVQDDDDDEHVTEDEK